jgi:hypothetical protein
MPQEERDEDKSVGLTDMVLDAEPEPRPAGQAKEEVRDPAREGSDPEEDLPLNGQ